MERKYKRVAALRNGPAFTAYIKEHQIDLPFDEVMKFGAESPFAQKLQVDDFTIGNRFTVLPMEGWDGTLDGRPSDLTRRRWQRFGLSGAKLIWGGEAVAVRHDGRANPNQLMINKKNLKELAGLRQILIDAHRHSVGESGDLLIGLQLTHSGRFARPNDKKTIGTVYRLRSPDFKSKIRPIHPIFSCGERRLVGRSGGRFHPGSSFG